MAAAHPMSQVAAEGPVPEFLKPIRPSQEQSDKARNNQTEPGPTIPTKLNAFTSSRFIPSLLRTCL